MISSATLIRRTGAALFSAATLFVPARGADQVKEVRLYALDCGLIRLNDMGYSRTPENMTASL